MLNESLLKQITKLEDLELEEFKKVVSYSINLILNRQNQMKLNQFIQIQEERGDDLTNICLALIRSLTKYRPNQKQFNAQIQLLPLTKERTEYLRQKIESSLYELRKIIYSKQLSDIIKLEDVEWRMEVEVARKHSKNIYQPNVLLNFKVIEQGIKNNITVNTDYSNLKHLHLSLIEAMKLHRSAKFKSARNSSV